MKIKNLVLSSTAALALFAISTTVANADSYTVKAGDTVSAIAANYNTSVSAIEKANELSNINLIFVGDKLEVNGTSTTTTATSAAPQSAASQATSSVASTATSASATSAASQSVTSQATSSAATSQATSSVATSQAASSVATSQATSSVASSQASSQASTVTTQQSQAQSSSATVTVTSSNTSDSDSSAKAWIANKESGGSYSARNGQYVGKYQLSSSYLNGDYSSANQDRVADQYVTSRYGSWAAAKSYWVANGSY